MKNKKMLKSTKKYIFLTIITIPFILNITSCSDNYGPVKRSWGEMKGLEELVGNMNDTSYSRVRMMKPRLNALNSPVEMQDYEGKFVWAEYVSPNCDAAKKQTQETKKISSGTGEQVIFLTILTANSHKYYDHATVSTAKQWSNRFNLLPERVLAAELWYKTVPEHRFFSPQGHTLFVHVGYLNNTQIRETINYYKISWDHWQQTGKLADWMTYN